MTKKNKIDIRENRQMVTSTHAVIPLSLYEIILREGSARAVNGDAECAQWFLNELIIRDKEARRAEYSSLRCNGKLKQFKGQKCVTCGKPADTIDHIIPIARGGTNDLSNLQPMCWECNKKKGAR
jgi:hypothetical protein